MNDTFCLTCRFCQTAYITGYDGSGIYEATFCKFDVAEPRLVDAGALRQCKNYKGERRSKANAGA